MLNYTHENHEAWKKLFSRMLPKWDRFANQKFLKGVKALALPSDRVPQLKEVNKFLAPLTGFKATAVGGYIPALQFFQFLERREFPTTVTIRNYQTLDYLPEPDIFHDIAGHVPMHTDPKFAEVLVKFGSLGTRAAKRGKGEEVFKRNLQALSRFFWFSIEFGLMIEESEIKAYGSGLLSSLGEIEYAVTSPSVQRYPFQLEWVINQSYEINHYQDLLFVVTSFDHLFDEVERLGIWLEEGKLDHIAPGEPHVV